MRHGPPTRLSALSIGWSDRGGLDLSWSVNNATPLIWCRSDPGGVHSCHGPCIRPSALFKGFIEVRVDHILTWSVRMISHLDIIPAQGDLALYTQIDKRVCKTTLLRLLTGNGAEPSS